MEIEYKSLPPDDKILNFCIYVKYKFTANTLLITGDNKMSIDAMADGRIKVWDTNTKSKFEDFFSNYGMR